MAVCGGTEQTGASDDRPTAIGKGPDPLDRWRVEVGPPGNEFSDPRKITKGAGSKSKADSSKAESVPPPESALRWIRAIAPDTSVTSTGPLGAELRYAVFENRRDRYVLFTSGETGLVWLEYTDKQDQIEEKANTIVPKGRRAEIPIDGLPVKMVETLAALVPESAPSQAWYADTLVGPRYIAKVGSAVFYATPGGCIRSSASIDAGGLSEVAPDATLGPLLRESLRGLLRPYRERFNFQKQIDRVRKAAGDAEKGFRFVVMGDSRSQKDLWEVITIHIDGLDPKPLFVINAGDVVLKGTAAEYAEYYVPPLLRTDIPYFVAIGNHDTGKGGEAKAYRYLFGEQSLNYSFDLGRNRFIFLDGVSSYRPWEDTLEMADRWLAETPRGYRKIVSTHVPPATVEKWAYHAKYPAHSKMFSDLMAKHRVDEVFLGHIHAYSTATLDGVSYTVAGGGGAELHRNFGPLGSVHHYVICDVTPEAISQQVVRFYPREGSKGKGSGSKLEKGWPGSKATK